MNAERSHEHPDDDERDAQGEDPYDPERGMEPGAGFEDPEAEEEEEE